MSIFSDPWEEENDRLRAVLKEAYEAMVADFGNPDDHPEDDGSVAVGETMDISFKLMRKMKEALK